MLVLIDEEETTRNYTFYKELEVLNDIYSTDQNYCFVMFMPELADRSGNSRRGGYAYAYGDSGYKYYVILIDSDCDLIEAATVLIHEYAHHLSQQGHDFTMFELWREYLREEFERRWNDGI